MEETLRRGRAKAACNALEIHAFKTADARFERGKRWVAPAGHMLEFTEQGDLELRSPRAALLWRTRTSGANAAALVLKTDGNLAIVDWRGYPVWSTGTSGNPGAFLALEPDGNLALYSADKTLLWETETDQS